MIVVLYEFGVKENNKKIFEENWRIVTDAFKRHCSSLGSRLHLTDTARVYVAYAQCPSDEIYDNAIASEASVFR